MLKLIGALIVLVSGTLVGFQAAKMYSMRPKEIRRLIVGLQLLETEICYGATPLSIALKHISVRIGDRVGEIFLHAGQFLQEYDGLPTADCWEMALEKTWKNTMLKPPEKEILIHLGRVLGKSDRQDQQKHIRLAVMNLTSEEEEARSEQQKYEKMCKSLGFLGGLLAVILIY
ncbi:MAG TPA: stage III sporulation protein SpoIIIAB [Bacillota bacterium]|nr:stage III sporulation protein SpoIIIAB [Bacillota bacterium]